MEQGMRTLTVNRQLSLTLPPLPAFLPAVGTGTQERGDRASCAKGFANFLKFTTGNRIKPTND